MEKAVKDVPLVSMVMPQEGHPVIASHVLALWRKLPTSKYAPLSLSFSQFILSHFWSLSLSPLLSFLSIFISPNSLSQFSISLSSLSPNSLFLSLSIHYDTYFLFTGSVLHVSWVEVDKSDVLPALQVTQVPDVRGKVYKIP